MDWTVAQAVGHMAETTLWYASDLAAGERQLDTMELRVPPTTAKTDLMGQADASGFAAMACDELLVHTDDAARGLGVPITPPHGLVRATLARLFPWAPDADPWPALLWCNGRVALPALPRQDRWAWHCAPLEEWDGLNPADRSPLPVPPAQPAASGTRTAP
jgi:acyl dehydratase